MRACACVHTHARVGACVYVWVHVCMCVNYCSNPAVGAPLVNNYSFGAMLELKKSNVKEDTDPTLLPVVESTNLFQGQRHY